MKFKLTKETKTESGIKFYRIEALKDFANISKGEKGGWVEKESNLSQENNAWISGDAQIYGNARISGDAWIYGNAQIFGDAWISGNARIYDKIKLQFGWCFGRKRKDWNVTELKNGEEILLIKDYKQAEEESDDVEDKTKEYKAQAKIKFIIDFLEEQGYKITPKR